MPTVLVPLDETACSESILPDALELAGPGGPLELANVAAHDADADDVERYLSEAALAAQWQGSVVLAQIGAEATGGQAYLDRMASKLTVSIPMALGQGKPGGALATLAHEHAITHVVMTSHERTGPSRVIAGDVAAQLIDGLSLPIIVVPALAAVVQQPGQRAGSEGHVRRFRVLQLAAPTCAGGSSSSGISRTSPRRRERPDA